VTRFANGNVDGLDDALGRRGSGRCFSAIIWLERRPRDQYPSEWSHHESGSRHGQVGLGQQCECNCNCKYECDP
jgi:hypothetical protein